MMSNFVGEDKLPLLSESLVLDHLWETLSACLLELEYTPDQHAVLVLQVKYLYFLYVALYIYSFRQFIIHYVLYPIARRRSIFPSTFIIKYFSRSSPKYKYRDSRGCS